MQTLLELVDQIERLGVSEAVRWTDGLRTIVWSYCDLRRRVADFAAMFEECGARKGDRVLIWAENRPEWIAAFWGAIIRGIVIVPVDYRFSPELLQRIQVESRAKLLVHGAAVDTSAIPIQRLSFDDLISRSGTDLTARAALSEDDIVEIVYTSGTTGEPKGVVHRHRNICSNLEPFRLEIDKYKKWAKPFQPIRILDLLPLSHMFGQSLGLFIPVLLGGSVAFTGEMRASATIRLVRKSRISVIVSVPRILEAVQHDVQQRFQIPSPPSSQGLLGVAVRWWRARRIHSEFGWKFWAFVVGGARVDAALEEFWANLGYAVIQGYGLTEASPVVAVNHPFDMQRGSLGKVVPGQEVKIAPDGEILVRGESVTGERGAWLATGDLGELDREGRLYYRGRKKDLIVTPEGLNVHPEDVECVLNSVPGVHESAVVAVHANGNEHVHAAIILADPSADPASIVGRANEMLEPHQRIRSWTVWPEQDFPRTQSTMKVRRHEVASKIEQGFPTIAKPALQKSALDQLLASKPNARLAEDLGLSSLDRVELLSQMENQYGVELDEEEFSQVRTVGDVEKLLHDFTKTTPVAPASPSKLRSVPRSTGMVPGTTNWPQYLPVRWFRWLTQGGLVLPLFNHYISTTVDGLEYLQNISPPVIFAANHTSHLDTVALVAALPPSWRRLLSPAMSKDHFRAWFETRSWAVGAQYVLARTIFNTYALPQRMSGVKAALEYTGELVHRGYCPLVFPEGERTSDGSMHPFRPGIGLMAVRLQVPVIPVGITGLYEVYSVHDSWPKRGSVRVRFGPPLRFSSNTALEQAATAIEQAVQDLLRS